MRRLLGLLGAAILALAAAGPAAASQSAQLYPIDLEVSGGEDAWHAENEFRLKWNRPPVASQGFPITAVGFQVRDGAGAVVVPEKRQPGDLGLIDRLRVPLIPGAYTADVWLEGPGGERGPTVSATLRFDDARPRLAQPIPPPGWVGGSAVAKVAIRQPAGPQPVSGIRGYAVSVDRNGESRPCAAARWCDPAEGDLGGGVGDDTVTLGALPEGVNFVRAVAVSGAGLSSAEIGTAIVRVDATRPETSIAGIPQGWASGPVRMVATAVDAMSGMRAGGPNGAFTAIAVDGGGPSVAAGDSAAATVAGDGLHVVAHYARDAAGNVDDRTPRTAMVPIDESPPRVAFARSQDPAEPERIEATVADSLSGADSARGSIAIRPAGTRQRWSPLPTVARAGRLTARWDSDSYPAGSYEFRATGYDVAGNSAASDRRGNGVRMVLANPLKTPVRLQAGFGAPTLLGHRCLREPEKRHCRATAIAPFENRSTTMTAPYGQATPYGGRLTSASGSPLGQMPVQVVESFGAGAVPVRRSTTVLTAADGSFAVRLRPGPSRRVEAIFAGTRTLGSASGDEMRLEVLAGVRFRASAATARIGGAPVVFRGQIASLGAPIPRGGLAVELQFRLAGGEWAEFRTVQTDSRGRFRYPYAFSDDDSRGVRFQFRAYMKRGDWPYEPAASKPVTVTGR